MVELQERVTTLEAESTVFQKAVFDRFNTIDNRMNTHLTINIGLWVTSILTSLAGFGSIVTILLAKL